MTFPNVPSTVNNSSTAKPPMSDKEIRLECVKQAVIMDPGSQGVISLAGRMFDFVVNGSAA